MSASTIVTRRHAHGADRAVDRSSSIRWKFASVNATASPVVTSSDQNANAKSSAANRPTGDEPPSGSRSSVEPGERPVAGFARVAAAVA
jgi:hypothetical protein